MTADSAESNEVRRGGRATGAPTLYDVARLAGVNLSTASRALSRPGRVNAETVERIRAAAEQLDFRVNPIARAFATGRTQTIALLVGNVTDPTVFDIIRGAVQEAAAHGHTLAIAESGESGEREATDARRLLPSVDGVILAATRLDDDTIRGLAKVTQLVTINHDAGESVGSVLADLTTGVDAAVAHLVELGHTVIGYLPGPASSSTSARRGDAIHRAAQELGAALIVFDHTSPTREAGAAALGALLSSPARAVIGFSDMTMLGVVQEAARRQIEIPGRLSVIGFDDIFGSDLISPPLTTIRMPLFEAGRRAVRHIVAAAGTHGPLPTELMVRASTGPPYLYQTYRKGMSANRFDVPDGSYRVTLRFTEITSAGDTGGDGTAVPAPDGIAVVPVGWRVFDVGVNGAPVETALDLVAKVGQHTPYDASATVAVAGGTGIEVSFAARVNQAILNAIDEQRI